MAYRDFKDLARKTSSDKVLRDELFSIVKNPKDDGYRRGIAFMVHKFFDKKTSQLVVLIMKLKKINNWLKNYKTNY